MINYDIKNIYAWPWMIKVFVIIMIAFLVFYLGYVIDIAILRSEINMGLTRENDLKEEIKSSIKQRAKIAYDILQVPSLDKKLKQWQDNVINASELSGTLESLLALGEKNNLKFNSFDPDKEIKAGSYGAIPVKINMTGTFDQIATFLSQVANMQKLILIDDFVISRELAGGKVSPNMIPLDSDEPLSAQLTLKIFKK